MKPFEFAARYNKEMSRYDVKAKVSWHWHLCLGVLLLLCASFVSCITHSIGDSLYLLGAVVSGVLLVLVAWRYKAMTAALPVVRRLNDAAEDSMAYLGEPVQLICQKYAPKDSRWVILPDNETYGIARKTVDAIHDHEVEAGLPPTATTLQGDIDYVLAECEHDG